MYVCTCIYIYIFVYVYFFVHLFLLLTKCSHHRFFFLSTTSIISNQIIKENTFSQQEKSLELVHTELYLTATFNCDINVLTFVMHTNMEKVMVSIPTNLLANRTCWFGFATHKVSLFPCFSFVVFGYNLQSTVHV